MDRRLDGDRGGREQGIAHSARFVLPNEPLNVWGAVYSLMGEDEAALVQAWAQRLGQRHEEIVLTGSSLGLVPHLARARVLDGLAVPMAGSEALWGCGAGAHRLGLLEHVGPIGELVRGVFEQMGVRRVVCFAGSQAAMLTEILPERYGVDLDVEVGTVGEWVLQQLERPEPVDARLALHGCGDQDHALGEVARRCCADVVEPGGGSSCCALAVTTVHDPESDSPPRLLRRLVVGLHRHLAGIELSGASGVVVGCPACYLLLNLIVELTGSHLQVMHAVELVDWASGHGPPGELGRRRAWDVLAAAGWVVGDWLLGGGGRFEPQRVDPRALAPLATPPWSQVRRIQSIAGLLHGPAVHNPLTRAALAVAIRAAAARWSAL